MADTGGDTELPLTETEHKRIFSCGVRTGKGAFPAAFLEMIINP